MRKAKKKRKKFKAIARAGFVYGLYIDPAVIRYVGQSTDPLRRLAGHKSSKNQGKSNIAKQWTYRNRHKLQMIILEVTTDMDRSERNWIAKLRALKMPLLNLQDGGMENNRKKVRFPDAYIELKKRWRECDPQPDDEDYEFLQSRIDSWMSRKFETAKTCNARTEFNPEHYS